MTRSLARAVAGCGLALAVLGPSVALADLGRDSEEWESRKRGSLGLSGGLYYPDSQDLQDVYGSSGLLNWRLGLGYRVIDLLSLDGGLMLVVDKGHPLGEYTGESSGDSSKLLLLGFDLGPKLRLDVFREQPLVPYGTVGGTWALFKEVQSSDGETVVGDKTGWYYAAGLELLLDRFQPARAADLDISRGINDSSLVFEYRRQELTDVGEESGLDFSADSVTLGLRFDF